ncbi:MAG: O-antigen/teichoic acid export membrane protein [Paracoccaceae bacterium]|jgi:O-antigen/teichoic acid export membrane protein
MKHIFTSFLSSGAVQIANVITGILAARLLLPEGRGELAFLLLWPALIADVGALSVNTAVSYYTAQKKFSPKQVFASAFFTLSVLSLLLMGAFALLMPFLFAGRGPELWTVGWVFLIFIPIHLYSSCLFSQFQGAHNFTMYNILRMVLAYSYFIFVVPFIWLFGETPAAFAYAFLVANAATLLVSTTLAGRNGWISCLPDKDAVKSLLSYGSRFHVSVLMAIVSRRIDIVVVTVLLSSAELGLYVAAGALAGLPMIATVTMNMLVFPKIATAAEQEAKRAILGRYLRATLILLLPATVGMIAIAPYLVRWAFGAAFADATDAVRIILLAGIPYTFKISITTYLRASDRMALVNKAELIGMIVSAIALVTLVPLFGIVGAASAQLIAALAPPIYFFARAQLNLRELLRFGEEDIDFLRELALHISRRKSE